MGDLARAGALVRQNLDEAAAAGRPELAVSDDHRLELIVAATPTPPPEPA